LFFRYQIIHFRMVRINYFIEKTIHTSVSGVLSPPCDHLG